MLLRLQKYTLKVKYCPVKQMYIADMLSRAYLQVQSPARKTDHQIFQLNQEAKLYKEIEEIDPAKHVRLSENGLASLRKATLKDETLSKLTKVIVVSIDRLIMRRMKNGRDLVTYRESYLVLVPLYSSLHHRLYK